MASCGAVHVITLPAVLEAGGDTETMLNAGSKVKARLTVPVGFGVRLSMSISTRNWKPGRAGPQAMASCTSSWALGAQVTFTLLVSGLLTVAWAGQLCTSTGCCSVKVYVPYGSCRLKLPVAFVTAYNGPGVISTMVPGTRFSPPLNAQFALPSTYTRPLTSPHVVPRSGMVTSTLSRQMLP